MKKLNGWIRLGIVVSVLWTIFVTFIYVDEIVNHPSFATRYYPLHKYFAWIDDIEGTEKAHEKAKAERKDFSNKWVFSKPIFNFAGYLQLTLIPVIAGWLGICLVLWVVRWVWEGFRA